MKKLFMMAIAALALMVTSCGNGQKANVENADEVEAVQTATDAIAKALESGDASILQTAIEAAKEKATELLAKNPEVAKEYLTKVQDFLKENAEKVQAIVGENEAVKAVVSTVTDTSVDDVVNNLTSLITNTEDAAAQTVEDVKAAGEQAVEDAKAAAQQTVDDAKTAAENKVNEEVQNAKDKANESIDKGVDAAKKKLGLQ